MTLLGSVISQLLENDSKQGVAPTPFAELKYLHENNSQKRVVLTLVR